MKSRRPCSIVTIFGSTEREPHTAKTSPQALEHRARLPPEGEGIRIAEQRLGSCFYSKPIPSKSHLSYAKGYGVCALKPNHRVTVFRLGFWLDLFLDQFPCNGRISLTVLSFVRNNALRKRFLKGFT